MYRIFKGPAREAKINLTYHVGVIRRGQKIKVTPKEAKAMDRLPLSWGLPDTFVGEADTRVPSDIKVTKKSKQRRKRKSQKKGE